MNYIVLVKQVPDIRKIPEEAWDWDKGILKRGLLDNVCNELDKQAIAFALSLREKLPGRIVALSMGPPFAGAVLKYALSVGADTGVLLTDRKLGGADTAATAYPLARAIKKIEKDIFKGDSNYIIISGMQSVDGDTAQVPAQVAEDLGIAQIAYATSFDVDDDGCLQVKRISRLGTETVSPLAYPCMITVTSWTLPPPCHLQPYQMGPFREDHPVECSGCGRRRIASGPLRLTNYRLQDTFSPRCKHQELHL